MKEKGRSVIEKEKIENTKDFVTHTISARKRSFVKNGEMKDATRRQIGNILWITSLGLLILFSVLFRLSTNEKFVQREFQRTVLKMDRSMQTLIDKGLNHEDLERSETGLTVFMSDTLVFWNRNDVSPRLLKRKIEVGHDTICPLLTGNYYVKSYQNGTMTYYVYRLINTTYQIENQYFENRLQTLPQFIEADIELVDNSDGTQLTNHDGKLLANYNITKKPRIKQPYRVLWPIPLLLLLFTGLLLAYKKKAIEQQKEEKKTRIVEIGMAAILVISIIGTYVYYRHSVRRENEQMERVIRNLVEKRDISFESSYSNFAEQLKADTTLIEMLFAESNVLADVIIGYSKELLFDTIMQSYNATLTICAPEEEIAIEPEDYVTNCDSYFLEKLANNKQRRVGDDLYFLDYYTLDPNYLGIIRISSKDTIQQKTLYFEFYKPLAPEGFGFPQLLQEYNSEKPYEYSVSSYRDNQLVYKYGRYVYPNFLNSLNVKDKDFTYSRKYKHYALFDGNNNALVISTPMMKFSEKVRSFAVFFLGLTIPFLLVLWLIKPKKDKKNRTFRQRLQTIIFLTLGIALIVIGPVSVFYMQTLYNQKTEAAQFETTRTLMTEMTNDLDLGELLRTTSRDNWNSILQHYATTFFTDLNLYQLNGRLLSTTRPEIYELHLQAPMMNAEAYQNIHRNKELFFTHEEHLGKGRYESSYIPLSDANGKTLAYLNTPYFSSNTDLHKEIMNFVLTYINIILVLLGVALIVILHRAKQITQPLALIQSKLGDLDLNEKNEPIEWKGQDEIGKLVEEYNKLIVKLDKSVEELKRTTTESAWRGVARQVAHEIKNSLTPMRLSVQLLQRKMENGTASQEEIQRTSNTLIEQIDALSDIASSFSRYAKLPENHPAPFDLAELVGNVVNLYDNADNIVFHYDYDPSVDHTYNGDKTNLNSAVTNLVKNAVQAIGSKPDGRIDVTLSSTDNVFVISVKDNGKGIKEEDKSQIFLPNFTTKTGGSGVGLSLTYNIIQAAGGTISFESQEGEGAEFVIKLPKMETTNNI